MPDLGHAAQEMSRVLRGVRDDQLAAPTPCPDYTLGDLVEHVLGLATAFTLAARKERPAGGGQPRGSASRLPPDWRSVAEARLDELALAWREEGAWEGTTHIAGFDSPADQVGATAMNELVVHGWDVARSSGQVLDVDDASIEACEPFARVLAGPDTESMRPAFGPPVQVGADASALDRIIAANGRDPQWQAARTATR